MSMQTELQTTGKAAAAAAARKMLASRITLVTTLGDAIDDARKAEAVIIAAKAAHATTLDTAREAHAAALAGGWTAAELRNAGLVIPTTTRRRKPTPDAATDEVNGETVERTTPPQD